jgi:hypothetical protein
MNQIQINHKQRIMDIADLEYRALHFLLKMID